MKIYQVEHKQILPVSKTDCWNFFSDPKNLQKITPPEMDFEIKSELAPSMYEGQIVIYRIKLLPGVKINWVTEITHVDEGNYFVDEQRFGPYKFWHHQHRFKEVMNGMEVYDLVHYTVPMGFIGIILNTLIIVPQLRQIFEFRKNYLEKIFPRLR